MTISYQKEGVVKLHKDKEHWKFYIDCARCGNEFEVGKNVFCDAHRKDAKPRFCNSCKIEIQKETGRGNLTLKTCDNCGNDYCITQNSYDNQLKKFGMHLCESCSRKGENNPFYGHNFTEEQLKVISDKKYDYYNNPETGEIHRKEQSEKYIGEKNPMYKADKLDPYQMISSIRNAAIERDNHQCQRCNKHVQKGNTNVHHLNGANKFEEERLDVDNLITLCKDCHILFHRLFGYGDNTKEQFDEYLKLGSETIENILNNR